MREVSRKNKIRIITVFGIILVLMLALALRLSWIQIVKADHYTELAIEQQTKDVTVEAKRGDILDRNGNKLATSAACYTLWVRPQELLDGIEGDSDGAKKEALNEIATKLAKYTKTKRTVVLKKITKKESIVKIARYIDKDNAKKIKKMGTPGVILSEGNKRYYTMGSHAAKTLGSVTEDNIGRSGIELQYDQYLSGIAGRWIKNTDINGDELSFGREAYYEAEDGYNVVTTMDEVIQYYVEKAISKGLKTTQAKRVMCIVMDPKTGDILAMATNPSFNPNNPTEPSSKSEKAAFEKMSDKKQVEYLNQMWRNSLVSDTYEPGSTFKLITSSSALEEGVCNTTENFHCSGAIRVANAVTLHCNENRAHGDQRLRDAVGNSCNTAHVTLALRLGATKFYDYLALFGITDLTNIDLPGEAYAQVQSKKTIGSVELATMGYGQGIAVTPIQLITAISAIGNGGVVMQPRIVKELTDTDGKTVKTFATKQIRRVLSEETASEMCKIMEYEVSVGGGGTAKLPGYKVGGKTGTANKAIASGYSNKVYSSFVCMAPMDDPQIAVLVICDEPQGIIYGSYTAAPIARDILEDSVSYLGIKPKYSSEEKSQINKQYSKVPSLTGNTAESAVGVLGGYSLKAKIVGNKSKVIDQYPKAGENVKKGTTVYIYTE